ncbi:MAG: Fic/DOC family protein [Microbacterium sp.]|uniref:Fic/DOC family protein n=1 Tax=Microbacterium sp. TaxID=51671 RepID=UPI003F944C69
MTTGWEAWEAYFYPETYDPATRQGTLRNKFGERNAQALDIRERAASAARALQLDTGDISLERTFGIEHLRAIHRHLFQDVYDWAGEIRNVRMQKDTDSEFARPRRGEIQEMLTQVQEHARSVDWASLDRRSFVNNIAVVIAFTNQAHPFREGNGRATQWFMRHIAEPTPFHLDFTRIERDAWNEASASSSPHPGRAWIDPRPLLALVDGATLRRDGDLSHAGMPPEGPQIRRDPDQNTGPITGPPGTGKTGPGLN